LAGLLRKVHYQGRPIEVIVDQRDLRGGEKGWSWIKKGIPLRLEIGPREIDADQLFLLRRDKPHREASPFSAKELEAKIPFLLEEIQANLLHKAEAFRDLHTKKIDSKEAFYDFFTEPPGEHSHGGFALCHWNESPQIEDLVKQDLGVTIRCIPLGQQDEPGLCPFTGEISPRRVIFAKSY
jgi:prolyl-tRNA synthetase